MGEDIVSIALSFIETKSYEWASGLKGKIKLFQTKRKLKQELTEQIVRQYGNRTYYNALDKFITNNNVLPSLLEYCYNPAPFDDASLYPTTAYYTNLFVEKNPAYFNDRNEIYCLLMKCYKIVFSCLNPIQNESERIILAHVDEKLSYYNHINEQQIKQLTCNNKANEMENSMPVFSKEKYHQYAFNTNGTYSEAEYIDRRISQKQCGDNDDKKTVLDIILEKKRVLLLGDAGFGKTNEAIRLLHDVCTDARMDGIIPVYLPLAEYGLIYDSIEKGLICRLGSFISGDPLTLIHCWLKEGSLVIIFDGIDDIGKKEQREKFILEANDFISQHNNNMYLFTSRLNIYRDKIAVTEKYYLSKIDAVTIRKALQEEGIYIEIPPNYYDLFSNPYFLSIGKKILKTGNRRQRHFNRSVLFEELFHQLYDGTEHGISKVGEPILSSYEALQILGQFAYESFNKPTYSYLYFDQQIGKLIKADKRKTISLIVSSGLFHCDDGGISFSHKLLKEYCVASFIATQVSNKQFLEAFLNNIDDDEWKEVFIFVAGALEQKDRQDQYLDCIMARNLPMYIECVKSKYEIIKNDNDNSTTYCLLKTMLDTYVYVVNNYFHSISMLFDPYVSQDGGIQRIGIRGYLSQDDQSINYWFESIIDDEDEVLCINQEEFWNQCQKAEIKQCSKNGRFNSYSNNLPLSGLTTDSGRLIAIKLIYDQLKDILEHRQLLESEYLLCERLFCIKHNYKAIREINSIQEIKEIVDNEIDNVRSRTSPNLVSIKYGRVDLIKLQQLLDYMCDLNIVYDEHLLPQPDIPREAIKHGYIWEAYSKERKKERIEKFLLYLDESYMQMTYNNFPALCNYFSRVKDHPCKAIALANYREKEDEDAFGPSVTYYYEAINKGADYYPEVREIKDELVDSDSIFHDIQESYSRLGREVNNSVIRSISFSSMIVSHRTGENAPLSDAVYDALKDSLEEIFGKNLL